MIQINLCGEETGVQRRGIMEGGCAKNGREGSHLDGNGPGRASVETGVDLVVAAASLLIVSDDELGA
jgi:hypothetical protein